MDVRRTDVFNKSDAGSVVQKVDISASQTRPRLRRGAASSQGPVRVAVTALPLTSVAVHHLAEGDSTAKVKRRKIHMNVIECDRHSSTKLGGQALTAPALTKTSSRDPNRGLYPRDNKSRLKLKNSTASASFVSAKDVLHQNAKYVRSQNIQPLNEPVSYDEPIKCSTTSETLPMSLPSSRNTRPRKKKLPVQSNSLLNYYQRRADKERTALSSPESSPVKTNGLIKAAASQQPSLQRFGFGKSSVNCNRKLEHKTPQRMSEPTMNSYQKPISRSTAWSSQNCSDASKITSTKTSANPQFERHNMGVDTTNVTVSQNLSGSGSDMYGLLGMGLDEYIDLRDDEDDDELNYFSKLPVEVIENILCRLPMPDLLLNVSLVCSQWNDIIAADRVSLK